MGFKVVSCNCYDKLEAKMQSKVKKKLNGIKAFVGVAIEFDDGDQETIAEAFEGGFYPKMNFCSFCGKTLEFDEEVKNENIDISDKIEEVLNFKNKITSEN